MSRTASQGPVRRRSTWASRIGTAVALALVGVVGVATPAQAASTNHYVSWETGEPAWQYINWGHWVGRTTQASAVRSGSWGVLMQESSMSADSPGEARRTFTYNTMATTCAATVYVRNLSPTSQRVRVRAERASNGTGLRSVTQTLPANSGWTKVTLTSFTANTTAIEISLYAYPFTSTGLLNNPYWAQIAWDDFTMGCVRL
ncbi:hypothetical protein ACIBQ2_26550 [Micromonospora sediminimaris]|uniref:hypothetical protein n=1 Tax=Micromonospora sediminimaris TaxID=547162 RepID=UPI0037995854